VKRAAWALLGFAGLAGAALVAACDDTNVHLLYGEQYDPQYMCMLPSSSIDVLNGPDPGESCPPVCITATLDGETYVYISTTCPPYDPYPAESQNGAISASDPCVAAFKAYCGPSNDCSGAASIECGPDGGPPEGGLEAGTDADAGFDATLDTGTDAHAEAAPETGAESGSDATTEAAPPEAGPEAAADGPTE
jgi:hypothetical protein